jgi:L-fuconolactonase
MANGRNGAKPAVVVDYVLEVQAKHPDRFCLLKPVDPNDPAVADISPAGRRRRGTVGVRVIMRDNARQHLDRSSRPRRQPGSCGGGEASTGGKPALLGPVGTGGTIGGPQSEHAARHRPPGLTAAVRAATAGAALGPIAEGAGARSVSQCCQQDHRSLHAGARTVPVPRQLGRIFDAFGFDRCMWGTDWTRAVKLPTYAEGVDAFRLAHLSDSDRAKLMSGTSGRIYNWSPAKA